MFGPGTLWRTFTLVAVVVLAVPTVAVLSQEGLSGEEEYRALDDLPTDAASVEDLEETAIDLVHTLGSIPPSDDAPRGRCPRWELEVQWEEPEGFEHGSYVAPVGPPPTEETQQVNGIVVCGDSTYAFAGFEAHRTSRGGWHVAVVPHLVEEEDDGRHLGPSDGDLPFDDDPPETFEELVALDLGPIDPYAPYEPQRICHPVAKPGAAALARVLLTAHEVTSNYGISRECHVGGRSEHKEGRAFDWGASASDPAQRAAVDEFISLIMATDAEGNEHAFARRMGVMYIIWDGAIWSSHRPHEGWRPYRGPDAHRDHVHISLSWDGAMGRTSLWEAILPEGRWWLALPVFEAGGELAGSLSPAVARYGDEVRPRDPGRPAREPAEHEAQPDRDPADDGATGSVGTGTQPDDGSDGSDGDSTTVDDTTGTVTDTVEDTEETVDDTVDETTDTVEETVDETQDTLEDEVDDVTGQLEPTVSPSPDLLE